MPAPAAPQAPMMFGASSVMAYGGAAKKLKRASASISPGPTYLGTARERERERVREDTDPFARVAAGSSQQNAGILALSEQNDWTPRGPSAMSVASASPRGRSHPNLRAARSPQVSTTLPDDPVTAIARLQSFDGSFQLNDGLRKLVLGDKVVPGAVVDTAPVSIQSHPQGEQIWATVIAIAYLKTKAADQTDIWAGLWEKAYEYVVQALQGSTVSFDQLVDEAAALL